MGTIAFILIVGIVLFIFFGPSEGFRAPNGGIIDEPSLLQRSNTGNNNTPPVKAKANPAMDSFKKKDYRDYEIKGMAHYSVSSSDIGFFNGWALSTFNSHDRYAVEIRHQDGRKFGYIPKGNFRMANYIDTTKNGRVPIWGYISNDEYGRDKTFLFGHVVIPVMFDEQELNLIESIVDKYIQLSSYLDRHESLDWTEAQEALDLDKQLRHDSAALKPTLKFSYANIMGLLTKWSIFHEKAKDYQALIQLGRYQALIASMPTARQNGIQKRIEKAIDAVSGDI